MSDEKPPWRKAIEDYERAIGAPLEAFIKSDEFADMAAKAAKAQAGHAQPGLVPGLAGAPDMATATAQWLHSMNLPAASDIAELHEEIRELRSEVRALREIVTSKPKRQPASRSKPAPKPKQKPKQPPASSADPQPASESKPDAE
jgi:hypothetical protein